MQTALIGPVPIVFFLNGSSINREYGLHRVHFNNKGILIHTKSLVHSLMVLSGQFENPFMNVAYKGP
jgi:hypothetical protein